MKVIKNGKVDDRRGVTTESSGGGTGNNFKANANREVIKENSSIIVDCRIIMGGILGACGVGGSGIGRDSSWANLLLVVTEFGKSKHR
ncbi:hypothetical protein CEXT_313541, partial [Caerostris extrusa]